MPNPRLRTHREPPFGGEDPDFVSHDAFFSQQTSDRADVLGARRDDETPVTPGLREVEGPQPALRGYFVEGWFELESPGIAAPRSLAAHSARTVANRPSETSIAALASPASPSNRPAFS